MLQSISILGQREWKSFVRFVGPVLFALFLGTSLVPAFAQQPGQRTFASAEEAGYAFFAATQSDNDRALMNILGPAGEDVVSSGDPEEDMDARAGFIVKYQEMHRFVTEPNGTVTLIVGAENWPFPIPLVNSHGSWFFDTDAGKDEILFRRTGRNELTAIDAFGDLVKAEKQYFARPPADTPKQFLKDWLATGAGTTAFTGRVLPVTPTARSTLPSPMPTGKTQKIKLATKPPSMA